MTTALQESEVERWIKTLLEYKRGEQWRLQRIYHYHRDPDVTTSNRMFGGLTTGPLRWLKKDVPDEVRRLAEMARVNFMRFVVAATTEVLFVDGFWAPTSSTEEPFWDTWLRNRMGARQMAVHKSANMYGASYATILPGDTAPAIGSASPRKMTAVYGDDPDWPELALEERQSAAKGLKLYRLYDARSCWWVELDEKDAVASTRQEVHDFGRTPVVRFLAEMDDDGDVSGDVEPLIALQDQINVTTFGLLVAQHYSAFKQRYIIGWTAKSEDDALKASAKRLWTFEDSKDEVEVGEFAQTDLSGYINSRESSLRHLATVSQTPAHELLGQLVNLSAEALAAAEANHRRKVNARQTSYGESWKQVGEAASEMAGEAFDPRAQVRWRDTEARSLSQMADALGKLVAGLGVPPQELWHMVPGTTQADVERWKEAAKEGDALVQLGAVIARQAGARAEPPGEAKPAAKPVDPAPPVVL